MRCVLSWSLVVAASMIGTASGQDGPPTGAAAGGLVVRVRIGHSAGMCGGFGYCTELTTVEQMFIVSEAKNARDKKKFPDRKTKRPITTQQWEDLEHSVDATALKAVVQSVGCRSCIDLPDSWVVVEFADGTRISVSYDPVHPPVPVAVLLRNIPTMPTKPTP